MGGGIYHASWAPEERVRVRVRLRSRFFFNELLGLEQFFERGSGDRTRVDGFCDFEEWLGLGLDQFFEKRVLYDSNLEGRVRVRVRVTGLGLGLETEWEG